MGSPNSGAKQLISIYYPNPTLPPSKPRLELKNKPQLTWTGYDEAAAKGAQQLNITVEEWKRRDNVVRQMYQRFMYAIGEKFYPPTVKEYEDYGECIVQAVVDNYSNMDREDWPKNDNPLIVLASTTNANATDKQFYCTTNYPQKFKPVK